jgi:hypothetical protein
MLDQVQALGRQTKALSPLAAQHDEITRLRRHAETVEPRPPPTTPHADDRLMQLMNAMSAPLTLCHTPLRQLMARRRTDLPMIMQSILPRAHWKNILCVGFEKPILVLHSLYHTLEIRCA